MFKGLFKKGKKAKEHTIVVYAQSTFIKDSDSDYEISKAELTKEIKDKLKADDVIIKKAEVFTLDVSNSQQGE